MIGNREGSVRCGQRSAWPVRKGLLTTLLIAGLLACAAPDQRVATEAALQAEAGSAPVERTVVSRIAIAAEGEATRVRLEADGTPVHRLTRSDDPPRAVLQLSAVTLEELPPSVEVGDGTVERITVEALPEGEAVVVFDLAAPATARVEEGVDGLDVYLEKAAAPPAAVTSAAPAQPVEPAPAVVQSLPQGGVAFAFGAAPSQLSSFPLSDGRRLVIDAEGAELEQGSIIEEFASGPLRQVHLARQQGRVRIVVEAAEAGAFAEHRLVEMATGFQLLLATSGSASGAPAPAVADAPPPAPGPAVSGPAPTGGGRVEDFGFRQDQEQSYVELELSEPAAHAVVETTPERVVLDVMRTGLPQKFQRALDTSAFAGPVRMVAAYPSGVNTRVVVTLRDAAPYRVERFERGVRLAFTGGAAAAAPPTPPEDEVVVIGEAESVDPLTGEAQKVYTGQRLSMDFVDADVRNVLRLIGDVSGLNIVAGDDVQGRLTIRLVDVPWDQALDVILKTRGLGQVRENNVVRIAPADRLADEKARALEEAKAQEEQEPLVTDIIPVSYASAEEISTQVGSVLSERGSVTVDVRTNSLLVKDVAQGLVDARALVRSLDTQTPQVLIEARIVEVSSTLARDLGIQWGGNFAADAAHGNATDWAFPHSVGVTGSTGVDNFAVNFPSAGGAGGPGAALGLTLGHVNDILTLDLRLSAIESSGHGRIISSPRVTTLDNRTAEISQGIEIPFTTATEEKIETQSIDYKLVLNVTPHVTADRSIIMRITVTKDAPSATFVAVDSSTPAKETRRANTEVMVRDGETAVIGGIITETQSNTQSGVPWFQNLPLLGWLFKSENKSEDKTEMIIFITPKIVNTQPLSQSL